MTRPQGDGGHGIVRQTVAPVAHQRQAAGGKLHADLVRPPAHGAHAPDPRTHGGRRPPALWRRSLRLAGRYALPTGAPLGVSFAPPPRHRGNAGARRSAAGRSRKKDGGAPPLNTPPPPAGSTGSGGGVIIENSYPEYTRCRCGGSRAFRIPRGFRAFRCVSLW